MKGTAASNSGDATSSAGGRSFIAVPYKGLGALSLSGGAQNQNENSRNATQSPHAASRGGDGSAAPASTQRQAPISFTAYDPNGRSHTQQRVPSETTSEASNATVVPARSNNWAKPTGSRNAAPRFTTPAAVQPQRGYESSSEDEM